MTRDVRLPSFAGLLAWQVAEMRAWLSGTSIGETVSSQEAKVCRSLCQLLVA